MAERRTRRRRRLLLVAGIVLAVVAVAVVGVVAGRPATGSAAVLSAPARRADVVVTVTASGSLVDQYTYAVAAGTTPVLTELAGVPTGSAASAGSSASGTSSASGSSSGSAGSSSASTAGGSGGYTTRSVAVSPGEAVSAGQTLAVARDAAGDDQSVKAPVAGHVRTISTAVGASASAVATIGAGRALAAVDVNENQIAEVQRDQTVRLAFGASDGTVTGTVTDIAQLADDSSGVRRYRVLVEPDSLPTGSRIGMTVSATIDIARHTGVVSVPAAAVDTQGGHDTVQVVGAEGAIRTVRVTVGLVGDSTVEITSGLTPGQWVVIGSTGTVPASTAPRAPGT